jgi:predicted transcriptional regulator
MAITMTQQDEMRQPAEWMRPKDDRILEALDEVGNLTPIGISREGLIPRVNTTASYASERCNKLVKYGLLMYIDSSTFAITDIGREYLAGNLDASTLDELDKPPIADE